MKIYYAHRSGSKLYKSKKEFDSYENERNGDAEQIVLFGNESAIEFLKNNQPILSINIAKKMMESLILNEKGL